MSIKIYISVFACKREAFLNNSFDEFLQSAKNVFNDSDRKVSKLKF